MIDQELINKLSDREKFCLEAYQITKNKELAYLCSRPNKSNAKGASLVAQVSRWFVSAPVQEWIKQYNEVHRIKQELTENSDDPMTRDELIRELTLTLRDPSVDRKTKADVGLKLATLENWKKEGQTEESEQIKYYLPQKCSQCALYKQAKEKLNTPKK